MRNVLRNLLSIIFALFLSGCCEDRELKLLSWNDNAIRLTETNCGATTAFLWKIYFHKNGSRSEKLIFTSYSSPAVETIRVAGDHLFIECGSYRGNKNVIEINLKDIQDFIDEPVYYYRSVARKTNSSFHEPEFIRDNRAEDSTGKRK